jgi:pimeloyl-ACP methyl ester carboxylesterase
MIAKKNIPVLGEHGRYMPLDYSYNDTLEGDLPVVIFCHGFKGFKDWGAWELMGNAFAKAGYLFIKFNYSHNGGTLNEPIDFPDLEAFGANNYSIEIRDTVRILDWVAQADVPADLQKITLIGHSRAGGICTIVAQQDHRVNRLITIASVADYAARFPKGEALKEWEQNGVYYIRNGRTHQEMPLYWQFYEDYQQQESQLDILKHAGQLEIPHLIIHGDQDPTVLVEDAYTMHEKSRFSELFIIKDADHVLGASHPWSQKKLPEHLNQAVLKMLNFCRNLDS